MSALVEEAHREQLKVAVHAVSAMIPAMVLRKLPTPYAPQTVGPGICQLI